MTTKRQLLFFGTPVFAAKALEVLLDPVTEEVSNARVVGVITQPDRPTGRGHKFAPSPVKQLALSHQIPVLQPRSLRKELESFSEFASGLGSIDLGVVVAFGQILPEQVLTHPRRGCLNIHASLLPRWRGAAPIQRAIMAGDAKTGVCLMRMDAGLDTGPVFVHAECPIGPRDTFGSLHDTLAHLGAHLLRDNLGNILDGKIPSTAQPESGVTYATKISSQEAALHFEQPARHLGALIRGLSPYPGAYCFLRGQRLKLLMAEESPGSERLAQPPGTILRADNDGIKIQCGDGAIICDELQLEGKKRLLAGEFLRGTPVSAGEMLGCDDMRS